MKPDAAGVPTTRSKMICRLRGRAALSCRRASLAPAAVFLLIVGGLSLLYFAGEIVVQEFRPIERSYAPELPELRDLWVIHHDSLYGAAARWPKI